MKYLPLTLEIVGSVIALATENYWFFLIALAGAAIDLATYFIKSRPKAKKHK